MTVEAQGQLGNDAPDSEGCGGQPGGDHQQVIPSEAMRDPTSRNETDCHHKGRQGHKDRPDDDVDGPSCLGIREVWGWPGGNDRQWWRPHLWERVVDMRDEVV